MNQQLIQKQENPEEIYLQKLVYVLSQVLQQINDDDLIIGNGFNGSIDEFRIYNHTLTQSQITNNFNLNYNKIVSEETAGGDNYMCQITPNDAEADGEPLNSSSLEVLWEISFNVRYGETGEQETNFNIYCNNSWNVTGVNSPYTTGFESGSYECIFSRVERFDRIVTFTADNNKTINVTLSKEGEMTIEEHTWLEAIYNCIMGGDCALYNLLLEINQTVGNIWEHTAPTDEDVVTYDITNKVVDSENNLTIDYDVYIPIKAGYSLGTYLPVRIGFWFLDENNETCYNQGDKPTGVEAPYCQPLIIETLGPMGDNVTFTVELQPQLPAGDYSIKQIIDIDPNNVWINYGQEIIGTIKVTESINSYGISLEELEENEDKDSNNKDDAEKSTISNKEQTSSNDDVIQLGKKSGITGGVIGASLLSNGHLILIVTIICITFIIFIIISSKTILKIKKK